MPIQEELRVDFKSLRSWIVVVLYPWVVGCFNASMDTVYSSDGSTPSSTMNTSIQYSVDITAPASGVYINHFNEAAFTVSGTCTNTGSYVLVSVAGYSSLSRSELCSSTGTWSSTLNLTSVPYDTQAVNVSVAVVTSSSSTGPAFTAQYSKKMCSASDYQSTGGFAAGTGSVGNPFIICTVPQFQYLMSNMSVWGPTTYYFHLMDDLNMSSVGSAATVPIGGTGQAFNGVFDGKGHTIFNYSMNTASYLYTGVFGNVSGATIQNLNLMNLSIVNTLAHSGPITGGLVAYSSGSQLNHLRVSGSISATNAYNAAATVMVGGISRGCYKLHDFCC